MTITSVAVTSQNVRLRSASRTVAPVSMASRPPAGSPAAGAARGRSRTTMSTTGTRAANNSPYTKYEARQPMVVISVAVSEAKMMPPKFAPIEVSPIARPRFSSNHSPTTRAAVMMTAPGSAANASALSA